MLLYPNEWSASSLPSRFLKEDTERKRPPRYAHYDAIMKTYLAWANWKRCEDALKHDTGRIVPVKPVVANEIDWYVNQDFAHDSV